MALLLSPQIEAKQKSPSYALMAAYTIRNYQEKTPSSERKLLDDSYAITAAYRFPYGFSLGLSHLSHTKKAPDGTINLQSSGVSLGFIGSRYASVLYTYLMEPSLRYDFNAIQSSTSYYGGTGSMIDVGLHWPVGVDWLQIGPRISLIEVHYKKSKVKNRSEIVENKLDGSPWRDRWLETYISLWFLF